MIEFQRNSIEGMVGSREDNPERKLMEQWVRENDEPIRQYIRTRLIASGGESAVEDVIQQTMAQAWKKLHQLEVKTSEGFRRWAFGIARNKINLWFRNSHTRRGEVLVDTVPDMGDPTIDVEGDVDLKMEVEKMKKAIESLEEKARTSHDKALGDKMTVVRYTLEGRTPGEIATLTARKLAAVKTLQYRGKKKVREEMSRMFGEDGGADNRAFEK